MQNTIQRLARGLVVGQSSTMSGQYGYLLYRFFASFAEDVKYAESHEWAKMSGSAVVVGISDHAQSELGDVVYVELPDVGTDVEKGKPFGVVESVKTASDVYAPVSGKVVEINDQLKDKPELVNQGAFTDGWMLKVEPSDPAQMDSLLNAAAYKAQVES